MFFSGIPLLSLWSNKCWQFDLWLLLLWGFPQRRLSAKESACSAGNARNTGSFPGSGRPPAEGPVNPLQYSYLENPMDRGTWRAIAHKIAKGWTWLKWLNTQHTHTHTLPFLNPACTSGSSWFMYCWSLAWRILSITLLARKMSTIVC